VKVSAVTVLVGECRWYVSLNRGVWLSVGRDFDSVKDIDKGAVGLNDSEVVTEGS